MVPNFVDIFRVFSKISPVLSIDFKALVHSNRPLDVLRGMLTDDNVSVIARVISKVPCESGALTSSEVIISLPLLFSSLT